MEFGKYPLGINLMIFSVVAVMVWIGGTRLAEYAEDLAQRYHLSRALSDAFLLADVTAVQEVSANLPMPSGNADHTVNNLRGLVMMYVVLLINGTGLHLLFRIREGV